MNFLFLELDLSHVCKLGYFCMNWLVFSSLMIA